MNHPTSNVISIALGACAVLGAAGVVLWNYFYESRRRVLLQQEISRLDLTVNQLRAELEAARLRKSRANSRRSSPTRSFRSFKTVSNYDSDEDEFFDFSSGGDDEFENESTGPVDEALKILLESVDELFKTGTSESRREAYSKLTAYISKHDPTSGILWRLAKCCHGLGSACAAMGHLDQRKEFILEGLDYAKRALDLNSNDAEAHKWFAVLTGAYGDYLGMKEKIEGGYVFKTHVEKAIVLRPEDASLRHLVGRFKYEVANLSWIERKVANTIFAEVPAATLPEAIEDFKAAHRLNPTPWKENSLFLAKCYIAQRDYSEAVNWLDDAASIPVTSCEDELVEVEVQNLLSSYNGYRKKNS